MAFAMTSAVQTKQDLARSTLGVLCILGLIVGSFWILRPFLTAGLWGSMIVVASWPGFTRLEARLGGRRGAATAVMCVGLLLLLLIPLGAAAGTIIGHVDDIRYWLSSLEGASLPAMPAWVSGVPVVGEKAAQAWNELAAEGRDGLVARLTPYAGKAVEWLGSQLGSLGGIVVQFLLTVVVAGVLYQNGEQAAEGVVRFVVRLAGEYGRKAVVLAAGAVRGVAMGVLVTAAAQSAIAGIGLFVAGVPAAVLLTSAVLVLCLAQVGPLLIMAPATIWKFQTGDTAMGVVLLVFTLLSGGIDNFLRPALIRRGADLPLLLIFAGVIGGMVSAGIVGIFIGPVVLAVTHTLLRDWVDQPKTPEAAEE
jgi:predicted PurR-regulated permease PerM